MTKNPILNALTASLYILGVVTLISLGEHFPEPNETFLAPLAMLSLLTLSAAVMAFTFFYQPVVLISKGEQEAAFKFLLQTIGSFALITVTLLVFLFYGNFF